MKVTKDMVDEGLQSSFHPLKSMSFLLARNWGIKLLNAVFGLTTSKKIKGLQSEERYIPSTQGGPDIRVRIFRPESSDGKLPAMLYLHPGGYVIGNPEMALDAIQQFIETRPCVVIAPAYRKAMEAPFPAGFHDSYDTLLWAKAEAESLGILADKFIVAGHSAGGGMTAAVTLKARDTQDVNIAFQMPIYPMIDDRQDSESAKDMEVPVWNTATNAKAWGLYLRGLREKGAEIPAYAAPARNTDYRDFPPTITFVGDLEPFRDETLAYVAALKQAGIPVAFKLYERCFHGFDVFGVKAEVAKDALRFTYDSYAEFYDTYIL